VSKGELYGDAGDEGSVEIRISDPENGEKGEKWL
jgi:hypothetical protein